MKLRSRPLGRRPTQFALIVCLTFAAFACSALSAEAWPDRAVKLVTLAGPGGGSDSVARIIAEALTRNWEKAVVVDNRPGADGILAIEALRNSHDGHTLLFASTGIVTANPLLHPRLPYDGQHDLVPITLAVEDFIAVVTSPGLTASLHTLAETAHERAQPLNYATVPGPPLLFALALQKSANFQMTLIAYRNPIAAVQDITMSRIEVGLMPLASVLSLSKAGQLDVLAVTNPRRAPSAPGIQTVEEQGFGELSFSGGLGFFASPEMPDDVRNKIGDDIRSVLQKPETRLRLEEIGYVVRGDGPLAFRQHLEEQSIKWSKLVRQYGIEFAE